MRDYELIRSKRKTVSIYITKDAEVLVRAPLETPKSQIDSIVEGREKWISSHIETVARQNAQKEAFTLSYGDTVLLMGKQVPITERAGFQAGYDGEVLYFPPGLSAPRLKYEIVQTYKLVAKRVFRSKVRDFATLMDAWPTSIRVTSAKTRWGSCSSNHGVSFSWRLVMADDEVIDYVVVHELAHISELNHSKRFWAIVEQVLPDYKDRAKRLKQLQKRLAMEEWDV